MRALLRRIRVLLASDDGSATAEYALVALAAAALAGVLFLVLSGANVAADIEHLIDRALSVPQ
jgi:hypothetical protein